MTPTTIQDRRGDRSPAPWLAPAPERSATSLNGGRAHVRTPPARPKLREGAARGVALLRRLRERNCVRWMLAYLAIAWMVLQMTDALREIWSWPLGLQRGITLALGLGILPAAVVSWYHGEHGRQRVCLVELGILAAVVAGGAWVIWSVCG